MNPLLKYASAAVVALPLVLSAQDVRVWSAPTERARTIISQINDRPMIGVTTNQESERADTLGLLVEDVRRDSPAAKAGLKAGDRLQAINGVNLRADRADAGERDYDGVLNRRLSREVEKTEAGKSIELRVYADGRARTVAVTPVKMSELYETMGGYAWSSARDDRAVIGFTIGSTGNARDTLGVFVSAVSTDGPADKAGIVEGDRIASINGVNLRVAREDADDPAIGSARANRLRREIEKLEAGQVAELVVVTAGRSRTVRVTTVKASDLPDGGGFGFFGRGMLTPTPAIAPTPPTPPTPPATPSAYRRRIITI